MSTSRNLPDQIRSTTNSSVVPSRVERAARRAEIDISRAAVSMWRDVELDALESRAIGEASAIALRVEFGFYDTFMREAGNSAVKMELLARKLDALARTNADHTQRRFG